MKVPKLRSIVVLVSAALVSSLALAAPAPAAPGAGFHLAFLAGPTDALTGETITSVPFAATSGKVQVELLNNSNNRVTNVPVTVTLGLGANPGGGTLTAVPVTTVMGIATFDVLLIDKANLAEVSDYTLVARSDSNPDVLPVTSAGFDIWESGQRCTGGRCVLETFPADDDLNTVDDPIADTYTDPNSSANTVITASSFQAGPSDVLTCDGYTALTNISVWHESTTGGRLFVVTHTSRDEMKNVASNGQVSVQLCLALSHTWNAKAGLRVVNVDGTDLYVGLAPQCPKKSPTPVVNCYTRQYGDGGGGNYTEAWLEGSDPGKRS